MRVVVVAGVVVGSVERLVIWRSKIASTRRRRGRVGADGAARAARAVLRVHVGAGLRRHVGDVVVRATARALPRARRGASLRSVGAHRGRGRAGLAGRPAGRSVSLRDRGSRALLDLAVVLDLEVDARPRVLRLRASSRPCSCFCSCCGSTSTQHGAMPHSSDSSSASASGSRRSSSRSRSSAAHLARLAASCDPEARPARAGVRLRRLPAVDDLEPSQPTGHPSPSRPRRAPAPAVCAASSTALCRCRSACACRSTSRGWVGSRSEGRR